MPKAARTTATRVQIARMVNRIVKEFNPQQIFLFGSQARGNAGPDSDIELLVVMDIEGPKLKKCLEIRGAPRDFLVPLDILVTCPEEFAWRKDVVGTVEWAASREGRVLYARV
jgi:predicted nucleotidyltransferase